MESLPSQSGKEVALEVQKMKKGTLFINFAVTQNG